jgi:hypothetical protein
MALERKSSGGGASSLSWNASVILALISGRASEVVLMENVSLVRPPARGLTATISALRRGGEQRVVRVGLADGPDLGLDLGTVQGHPIARAVLLEGHGDLGAAAELGIEHLLAAGGDHDHAEADKGHRNNDKEEPQFHPVDAGLQDPVDDRERRGEHAHLADADLVDQQGS